MKRQLVTLVALLASSSLIGCGGKKTPSSSSIYVPPVVTGISVNSDNVKKEYTYGDALDLAGLVVNANYDDGTSQAVTSYTTDPANGATLNTHGANAITVSYESFSASFNVTVGAKLTGMSVNSDNVKKEYVYGEALDLSGLVVSANFSDGSSQPVTNYTVNPANGTVLNTHGANPITVSFESYNASFDVTVGVKLTGITVDSSNVKKDYFLDRGLDLDGLVVSANYSDGTSQAVTNYTVNPEAGTAFDEVGQKEITVSYQSFSDSFNIVVIDGSTPIVVPEADSSKFIDNTSVYRPDDLIVNNRIVSVLERGNDEEPAADSTYQLVALPQFGYSGKNATFTSNDPTIATVSETGLITGISAGETVVVVADKDDPTFKTEVKVYVSPEIDIDEAKVINDALIDESKANDDKITALVDNEMYIKTIYRTDAQNNTSIYSYDRWDQRFVASKDDAYFRIWETDADIKAPNGAMDFTNFDWIFHTDEYYETYLFHQSGDVKNFLDVPTQNYLDIEGHQRTDPLLDILDNIFNNGKGYFNNVFSNARLDGMTDLVGYSSAKNVHYGSRGDGCFFLDATIRFTGVTDLDDENRYGIPYGTQQIQDQRMIYTIENNRVTAFAITIDETYSYGGYNYHAVYEINHTYQDVDENKTQIYVPALKDYTEVSDIYDL